MKSSSLGLVLALALLGGACATEDTSSESTTSTVASAVQASTGGGGMGMRASAGMMQRHQTPVPTEYSGLTNPVVADEESLARGAVVYATCAVCHGETGLGDGAAGAALDPAPANIAHTSQMMGDDYFFWRISEGGAQFDTLMPAWKDALSEQERWDVINYVQALGAGTTMGGPGMGMGMGQGQGTNAQAQAVQQAALLQAGVEQGVITQAESDLFATVHPTVDAKVAELRGTSAAATMLTDALTELVATGALTQDQADAFQSIHDRLSAANLLP